MQVRHASSMDQRRINLALARQLQLRTASNSSWKDINYCLASTYYAQGNQEDADYLCVKVKTERDFQPLIRRQR